MQELGATNSGIMDAARSKSTAPLPRATIAMTPLQPLEPKRDDFAREADESNSVQSGGANHMAPWTAGEQTEQTPNVMTEQTEQTFSDPTEQTERTEQMSPPSGEQTPGIRPDGLGKQAPAECTILSLVPSRLIFLRYVLAHRAHFDREFTPWSRVVQDTGLSLCAVRRSAKALRDRGIIRTEFDELHRRGSRIYVREEYAQMLAAMDKSLTSKDSAQPKPGGEPTELSSAIPTDPTKRTDPTEPPPLKIDRLREIHPSEEITESLWRLSDELFAHHWPTLFAAGLSANDVREAIQSLRAVGKSTARLMDGLEHAEFELSTLQGPMLDAQGRIIGDLAQYVGKALKKTGYYRRPEGYVSPTEQHERDAKEEAQKMVLARKEREAAEYQAWLGSLPPEQRAAIENGGFAGPPEQKLKFAWIKSKEVSRAQRVVDSQQAGSLTSPKA